MFGSGNIIAPCNFADCYRQYNMLMITQEGALIQNQIGRKWKTKICVFQIIIILKCCRCSVAEEIYREIQSFGAPVTFVISHQCRPILYCLWCKHNRIIFYTLTHDEDSFQIKSLFTDLLMFYLSGFFSLFVCLLPQK